MKPNEQVLRQFNLEGEVEILSGGEGRTFRVGNTVLKHINNDSVEYTNWIADLYNNAQGDGFRVPKPIADQEGKWVTSDGWSAWEFLEGNHDYEKRIPESIQAIQAFHQAISKVAMPDFLKQEDNAYTRADKYAWGDQSENINPELQSLVNSLYKVRKPVEGLTDQIIHGDLNPNNILISDSLPPAIIDIAPYWRPAEFALAIYAYWIACYKNQPQLLEHFSEIKEFDQMLVRAGIRMLLIMSELNRPHDLEKYHKATEIIIERVKNE